MYITLSDLIQIGIFLCNVILVVATLFLNAKKK